MFWISAMVFISATILFWLFGSAEIQPWNDLNINKSANITSDEEKELNAPAKSVVSSGEEEKNEKL